ncbi:thioredoxin [Leifsonia sp. NCR5]|uniref:thioredoxin n=1 Tax=Leifsonia sp. NCR5 TaxID=1978342 RepID=UPI000A1977DF|nr:thioredoxin [Leifsonia sp. NCR5]
MGTKDLTTAEFGSIVSQAGIVLVDFWAAWCGPCRMFAPVYAAASEQHPEMVFEKVDTEAEQELATAVGITSIPTLMIFRDGVLVFSQPGAMAANALDELIAQVGALDMNAVRAQLASRVEEVRERA